MKTGIRCGASLVWVFSLAVLLGGTSSPAAVMTFTGLPGPAGVGPAGPGVFTENGMTATATSNLFWAWPSADQLHLDPSGFAGNTVNFTFGGSAFNFTQVDISYASSGAVARWTGFDLSNNPIVTFDMAAGSTGTQTVTGFTSIFKLQLIDLNAHLSIDNLTLTPIPEPVSATWLGLGAVVVGLVWRRRSS